MQQRQRQRQHQHQYQYHQQERPIRWLRCQHRHPWAMVLRRSTTVPEDCCPTMAHRLLLIPLDRDPLFTHPWFIPQSPTLRACICKTGLVRTSLSVTSTVCCTLRHLHLWTGIIFRYRFTLIRCIINQSGADTTFELVLCRNLWCIIGASNRRWHLTACHQDVIHPRKDGISAPDFGRRFIRTDLGTEATQTLKRDAASSCQLVKEGTLYTTCKGFEPMQGL